MVKRWVGHLRHSFPGLWRWIVGDKGYDFFLIVGAYVLAAWLAGASGFEIMLLVGLGVALMAVEMLNTSLERLCNVIEPNKNSMVKDAKDMSSGASLILGLTLTITTIVVVARSLA
jgi:diacylglycerol kinase